MMQEYTIMQKTTYKKMYYSNDFSKEKVNPELRNVSIFLKNVKVQEIRFCFLKNYGLICTIRDN